MLAKSLLLNTNQELVLTGVVIASPQLITRWGNYAFLERLT